MQRALIMIVALLATVVQGITVTWVHVASSEIYRCNQVDFAPSGNIVQKGGFAYNVEVIENDG